jgi:hypothetical protein
MLVALALPSDSSAVGNTSTTAKGSPNATVSPKNAAIRSTMTWRAKWASQGKGRSLDGKLKRGKRGKIEAYSSG